MEPNFFIIGAPKCCTTALAHYLSEHPNVFMSQPKEPFFWSDDIKESKHELRPQSLDEYLSLFNQADPNLHTIVGEGSTRYLRSLNAVPNIIKFNPNAKFIAMLRNPLDVVQAFHMEQVYVLQEDQIDFAKAWKLQSRREAGFDMPKNSEGADYVLYRQVASFSNQIERLIEAVPSEQTKIIIFDDFIKDCQGTYKSVLDFLNIEDDKRTHFPPINSSHAQKSPLIAKFILYPPNFLVMPFRKIRKFLLQKILKLLNL